LTAGADPVAMAAWIALVRGINVGGNRRLPMQHLASILTGLGARDVRTYIQSGNAVFDASTDDAAAIASRASGAIEAELGFGPHVLVRSAADVARAVERNPFPAAAEQPTTLHVFFLDEPPPSPDLPGLEALRGEGEAFVLDGSVLYFHAPGGLGRSKLAARAERLLGVPATARNWATVTALVDLAGRT
jgi:uncharacterized protein (DUF1697 family)